MASIAGGFICTQFKLFTQSHKYRSCNETVKSSSSILGEKISVEYLLFELLMLYTIAHPVTVAICNTNYSLAEKVSEKTDRKDN